MTRVISNHKNDPLEISYQMVDIIMATEELRLKAYKPTPNDRFTIGYGTTYYPNGRAVMPGDTCSKEEAVYYFVSFLAKCEEVVVEKVRVELNQHQYDALVSFIYNIGAKEFSESTLLRKLNIGDILGASKEFDRWIYQEGQILPGLVKRRKHEKQIFLSGNYDYPKVE